MPTSSTLPSPIRDRLASARHKMRAFDVALGLARAVLVAAAAALVLFGLDTSLQPPLGVLRAFALFVVMVGGAGVTVFLANPLRRRLSDDDVALVVEDRFPNLEGLVSSVQLARDLGRGDHYTSEALIRATIDKTAREAQQVDFGETVRMAPLAPLWLLIGVLFVMGGGILSQPAVQEYAGIFFRRVVLGDEVSYPTRVGIRVDLPSEILVAKGDDLVVNVFVAKGAGLVERLTINTRFEGATSVERRDLLHVGAAHYRKSYQNVTEPFSFYVEAPDYRAHSSRHRVVVVTRPRIEEYEFLLDYPDYVGKPTTTVHQPDLQVPAGTTIAYVAVANRALAQDPATGAPKARVVLETDAPRTAPRDGQPPGPRVRTTDGPAPTLGKTLEAAAFEAGGAWSDLAPSAARLKTADRADRTLFGRLTVTEDVRFSFQLESADGLATGKRPVVFSVRVVPDKRPVVTIPVPGRRRQVTPQARIPVEVDARDDYGLVDVVLRIGVQKADAAGPPELSSYERVELRGLEADARRARLQHTLDVAEASLAPGDRLHYFAVAYDRNVDEARRSKRSRPFELTVVRPEDLERMLQDRLLSLKERLRALAREQSQGREAGEAFVAELGPKDVLTEDDKRSLQRMAQDQQRLTHRLVDARKELDDLTLERQQNRLTEEGAMALLGELTEGLRDLAERASPRIVRDLEDGRAAAALDGSVRSRLGRVPDLQLEVEGKLLELAARIDKWGDFTEVLQEVRDLLRGEQRVIDETTRAAEAEGR